MKERKERLALDISSPIYRRQNGLFALTKDLASLSLEAADLPSYERINTFTLVVTPDGKVTDENGEVDVSLFYANETDLDRVETQGALAIREALLKEENDFIAVRIKPPHPYPQGRLEVGFSKHESGIRKIESYEIPLVNYPDDYYLDLARKVDGVSKDEFQEPSSLEEVRGRVFFLKPEIDPFDSLESLIPLDEVWQRIKEGRVKSEKKRRERILRPVSKKVLPEIIQAKSREDFLFAGAFAERELARIFPIDLKNTGCGLANSELLAKVSVFDHTHGIFDRLGKLVALSRKTGVFVKACPYCARQLNLVIEPGFRCYCGQIYEGVC